MAFSRSDRGRSRPFRCMREKGSVSMNEDERRIRAQRRAPMAVRIGHLVVWSQALTVAREALALLRDLLSR